MDDVWRIAECFCRVFEEVGGALLEREAEAGALEGDDGDEEGVGHLAGVLLGDGPCDAGALVGEADGEAAEHDLLVVGEGGV